MRVGRRSGLSWCISWMRAIASVDWPRLKRAGTSHADRATTANHDVARQRILEACRRRLLIRVKLVRSIARQGRAGGEPQACGASSMLQMLGPDWMQRSRAQPERADRQKPEVEPAVAGEAAQAPFGHQSAIDPPSIRYQSRRRIDMATSTPHRAPTAAAAPSVRHGCACTYSSPASAQSRT